MRPYKITINNKYFITLKDEDKNMTKEENSVLKLRHK